jgi:hypothetical protein
MINNIKSILLMNILIIVKAEVIQEDLVNSKFDHKI